MRVSSRVWSWLVWLLFAQDYTPLAQLTFVRPACSPRCAFESFHLVSRLLSLFYKYGLRHCETKRSNLEFVELNPGEMGSSPFESPRNDHPANFWLGTLAAM